MKFPQDYIVWDMNELSLIYNLLPNNKNPFYLNIKSIEKSNEWLSKVFNRNNTSKVYYIEYYGEPGYEVPVLIIKCRKEWFKSIKEQIKKMTLEKLKIVLGQFVVKFSFLTMKTQLS